MKVLNVKEILEIESQTINELGIQPLVLMERAGLETFYVLKKNFPKQIISENKILIVVGTGNNGGDGLVLARLLFLSGKNVEIIFIGDEKKKSKENIIQTEIIKKLSIPFHTYSESKLKNLLKNTDMVIDALFGIGLKRDIENKYFELIDKINDSELPIVSLDIPSGIEANTGKILGFAIKADYTVTYGFMKIGLFMDQALDYIGKLICVDIGIPKLYAKDIKTQIVETNLVYKIYPKPRKKNSFKNKYGRVLLIGGSVNMSGAIILSAKTALKSGVGLANILTEKDSHIIVASQLPTAMTNFHEDQLTEEIKESIKQADCIVFGPGMNPENKFYTELLEYLTKEYDKTLVIDAGGLNILSSNIKFLEKHKPEIILTPHPGELARLMQIKSSDIQSDRIKYTNEFLSEYKSITLVLKGAKTIIANKDSIFINNTGNAILARGGSGDILSGIIGAFCSQSIDSISSAILGNYIHGLAGDIAIKDNSENSMISEELIDYIGNAFSLIEKEIEKTNR